VNVVRLEIDRDGKIVIVAGKPNEQPTEGKTDDQPSDEEDVDPWNPKRF
jgi:hypothetical protein